MRLDVYRFGACLLVLAGLLASAGPSAAAISLSVALKNYYAEYEIVQQCARRSQLTGEDVEAAGAAMTKIEKYYLGRDEKLNKARLKKQATKDKNDSFKILSRSGASGLRPYCQMSLNELLRKAQEVVPEPAS